MAEDKKIIVFDSGPVISLTLNNLLWTLKHLKERFGGRFCISPGVQNEIVARPLETKKYKFEALQVSDIIREGILEVVDSDKLQGQTLDLLNKANSLFSCRGENIQIVHYGEMSSLALALEMNASAFVVDERTTRLLIEDPYLLMKILSNRLHAKIQVNKTAFDDLRKTLGKIRVIRSVELGTVAFKAGLLNKYLPEKTQSSNPKKILLDSVLWGLKLNGCSISEDEIEEMKKIVT